MKKANNQLKDSADGGFAPIMTLGLSTEYWFRKESKPLKIMETVEDNGHTRKECS
jgi:hypothetical protein